MGDVDPVDEVFALFDAGGGSNYDEAVTLTEHCVQTAALAMADDADAELVAAALMHDVGHFVLAHERAHEHYLTPGWDHDRVGAEWLRPRFGDRVADAVGSHVDAKRYLCTVDPSYHGGLSAASKASFEVQGGRLSDAEAAEFRRRPGAIYAIRLRRWDDDGKVDGLAIPALASFEALLRSVVGR